MSLSLQHSVGMDVLVRPMDRSSECASLRCCTGGSQHSSCPISNLIINRQRRQNPLCFAEEKALMESSMNFGVRVEIMTLNASWRFCCGVAKELSQVVNNSLPIP